MNTVKTDVIIPAYRPGEEFEKLLERLSAQKYPVNRIIVMNTEEKFWKKTWEEKYPLVEVHHLTKEEFDHGATRRRGAELSDAEILVFMTQDALPADRKLIGSLVTAIQENEKVGAAYARQLPKSDCGFLEKYTRSFNYPSESCLKTEKDLATRGIKTYFCSNVCAMYRASTYQKLGGFEKKTIFNEDMIFAGKIILNGGSIAYVPAARVIHSHNYGNLEQLRRNFDLAVSQAEHPEIFALASSESEGMKLVKQTAEYLVKSGHAWLLPELVVKSGFKFIGYRLGKAYRKLPESLVKRLSMNKSYWEK